MELRKGDRVSVTGTVKYTPDKGERIFVKIDGSHEELWCEQNAVKLVQAKFEIGDRVMWFVGENKHGAGIKSEGEILAISGEHVWIDFGDGNYCTRHFGSITRLPAPPEEEPPQPVDDGSCDPLYGQRMDSADMGEEPRTAAGSLD